MPPAKVRLQANIDADMNALLEKMWQDERKRTGYDISFSEFFNTKLKEWLSEKRK